jgi:hypothetical protein
MNPDAPMGKVLAIIGSVRFQTPRALIRAKAIIVEELDTYKPDVCISGGAEGIDSLFQKLARRAGYRVEDDTFIEYKPRDDILDFPPGTARWNAPGGYKTRNIIIAEQCTRMVVIRSHTSLTYGSGWTGHYAQSELGRDVRWELL